MKDRTEFGAGSATPARARRDAGRRAELAGRSAEAGVAAEYDRMGYDLLDIRWRGQAGEIDLVFGRGDLLVFTEVKKARSFEAAVARLCPAQMRRIHAAASEYLASAPRGQLSDVRFDLAAVDAGGRVQVTANAFGHF